MRPLLLDGSRDRSRGGEISGGSGRFARPNPFRRQHPIDRRGVNANGMNFLSAVLLAGGESRRMGQDKAALIYKGEPLWRRQLDLLRALEPEELLLSARTDPTWRPADVIFVADIPPSRGPLSGLAAALETMSGTHLLVLAVDMPFMDGAYLRSLCAAVAPGSGGLPMIGDRAEPLAAIYPAAARSHCLNALAGNDFSLRSLTTGLVKANLMETVAVRPEAEHLFHNLNDAAAVRLSSGAKGEQP